MSQEQQSKELVLTNPVRPVGSKPRLISVGRGRAVSTSGLRVPLVMSYLLSRATEKFIPVGELSAVFCGGNTIHGKKRVRARLPTIAVEMAKRHGQFLITETEGSHNKTSAVKLLDPSIPGERQAALEKIRKMRKRREITQEHYDLFFETVCKFEELESA